MAAWSLCLRDPYSLTFICNPRWLLGALPRPLGRVQRGGNRACPLGWAVAPGPVPAPTVNTCPFSCVLSATFPAFLCFFLVISLLTAPEPGPKVRLVFPRAGGWDVPSGETARVSRASSGRGTALPAEPGVHEPAACVKVSVNRSARSAGSVRPLPSRRWPGAQGPGPACPRSRGQRPLTPYSVTLQKHILGIMRIDCRIELTRITSSTGRELLQIGKKKTLSRKMIKNI